MKHAEPVWAQGKGRRSSLAALLGPALLCVSCTGEIAGSSSTDGDRGTPSPATAAPDNPSSSAACTQANPGPSPLRRLTHREYNNTMRDLVGDTSEPATKFSPEEVFLGFDNNATARGTTPLLAEQYMTAAESLAARMMQAPTALTGCAPDDAAGRDACAQGFIDRLAARAYRRPLDNSDRSRLSGLFAKANAQWGFEKAIELVLQAVFQSPHFLYRVELGTNVVQGANVMPVTQHALASRLSYLLWASMPDQALIDAADSQQLATREQVTAHARRLLSHDRARYVMADFHRQWLGLDKVSGFDSTLEGFSSDLRPLLRAETTAFVDAVIWQEGGQLSTLLTAPFSFMNARLAGFYGAQGPTSDSFERVALDPSRRVGLLTQGGLLAAHSHAAKTSPVLRGKFVREQFLCNPPPPPPPGIDFTVAEKDTNSSVREQAAIHSADPACAGCHSFMDPIGLAFEGFDAIGRYRELENGKPIDTSGELVASDVDGAFSGPAELAERLAKSEQVRDCMVTQWFRYAYARDEAGDQDLCTTSFLEAEFEKSNGNIPELLFALTQTDAFLYRTSQAGELP